MPGRCIPVTAAAVAVAAVLTATDAPAAAAGGFWGAGHYAYAAGRVCRSGAVTSPLAAWTVADGHRGFLTRPVTSDGRFDSAAPPVPAAGPAAPPGAVTPGGDFGTAADIAALARLLGPIDGADPAGPDAATVAAAVLVRTDPANVPPCADTAAAAAVLDAARQLAGPYEVTVTPPAGPVHPGAAVSVTATVRSAAGRPVAGTPVRFDAAGARLGATLVRTGDDGVARTTVSVSDGTAASTAVTATAQVSTGLVLATVIARPSATNPRGASVPAVYAAAPTTYRGRAEVTIDRTAHPRLSTGLGSRLLLAGSSFVPVATVTGLNGHAAEVTFALRGPLPLAGRALCAGIAPARWNGAAVRDAATSSIEVTGDGAVRGDPVTPARAGCYAVGVSVATTDANPAVRRQAPLEIVTVVDTSIDGEDDQPAIAVPGAGTAFTGRLRVGTTYGLRSAVRLRVTGPVRPPNGDCATATAWSRAPHADVPAATRAANGARAAVTVAGSYDYSARAPSAVGCYRLRPTLVLTGADGESLAIPASGDRAAYVVKPTVTATVQRTWTVTPGAVPVQVEVDGLYGLAARVRVAMYVADAAPNGCDRASFAGARRAGNGPDTAVPPQPGVLTVAARSGPTPSQGCYSIVPELVLTADPRLRVTGSRGEPGSTLIAGVDPEHPVSTAARIGGTGTPWAFLLALSVLGGLVALVAARVAFAAWRGRDEPEDAVWHPLGPPDEELPSSA